MFLKLPTFSHFKPFCTRLGEIFAHFSLIINTTEPLAYTYNCLNGNYVLGAMCECSCVCVCANNFCVARPSYHARPVTHTYMITPLVHQPENNNTPRTELIEHHLLNVAITPTGQVTELGLSQLNVSPHLQHVRTQSINHPQLLLKLTHVWRTLH